MAPAETPAENNDSSSARGDGTTRPEDFPRLDNTVIEEMDLIVDGDPSKVSKTKRGIGGAMLAAGMIGLGEIIEPTKTEVEMEQVAETDDPENDPLAGFDFGGLPPLN